MCIGDGGGGSSSNSAPVAGGYAEVNSTDAKGGKKYKLYDNAANDISAKYKVNDKKKVVNKDTGTAKGAAEGNDPAANYLYTGN